MQKNYTFREEKVPLLTIQHLNDYIYSMFNKTGQVI